MNLQSSAMASDGFPRNGWQVAIEVVFRTCQRTLADASVVRALTVMFWLANWGSLPSCTGQISQNQPPHLSSKPWMVQVPTRCIGHYQSEAEAVQQLDRFRATFHSKAEWQRRAAKNRQQLLEQCGLDPLPERTPLNTIRRKRRQHDGYVVESIAFESLPGFLVFGSLYYPDHTEPDAHAAVLSVHGHGHQPNGGGRLRPANQFRCATLARMGAVVLAVDMIGFGESKRNGWMHKSAHALPLQLWSNIRAIDLLFQLPEVDKTRLAVTGASGGGTQTYHLAMVDDRVTVSVPVCMVSAHFFGGCVCETGHPIHLTPDHETNNVDFAASFAPKPQLLVSVGGDWTKNTPKIEFPYVQEVYALYGAEENVENAHFADEQHDYGPSKRKAMYAFVAKHLSLAEVTEDQSAVAIESADTMSVFDPDFPLPKHVLKPNHWPPLRDAVAR